MSVEANELPRIAITMGDPAGIGPEIALQVEKLEALQQWCVPIIFGDAKVLSRVAERLQLGFTPLVIDADSGRSKFGELSEPCIYDLDVIGESDFTIGQVNAATGRAAYRYIEASIDAAIAGDVAAVATGPINKADFHLAAVPLPGHTEIFAAKTAAERTCMMLTSREITCSLVTAHVGIRDVPGLLSVERIRDVIELTHDALGRIEVPHRKIVVCGLNPHAGEGGLFGGQEEERFIVPAIDSARQAGIEVEGPLPSDTAFLPERRDATGAYVCLYPEQGLIPLKTLAFDRAVNVTLALPNVRTSVDHGTALDIAWQGKASTTSMERAVELAVRLARRRSLSASATR